MALTNPRIAYKTIRDSLLTLFRANKTTLNSSLTLTFSTEHNEQIKAGNPITTPFAESLAPLIFVKVVRKEEEFAAIEGSNKRAVLTLRIFGITKDMSASAQGEDEILILTSNIEAVLRDNIAFDENILYSQPTLTDFGLGEDEQGTFVQVVAIDVQAVVDLV